MAALVESGGLALVVLDALDLDPQDVVEELRARETLTYSGLSAPIRAALEDIRSRLVRLEDRRVS